MDKFTIIGRVVTHTARPRFSATFSPADGGAWEAMGDAVAFLDPPPRDAVMLARLMREAGDFFAANLRRDWIQDMVIERVAALGMTIGEGAAYQISAMTGGAVSEDHIQDFLTRRKSMGSHKLQHVLRALAIDDKSPLKWKR